VAVIGEDIRKAILKDITAKDYITIAFTLKCSEETLTQRHKKRGDFNELFFQWLRMDSHPDDYVINTDHKTISQIVDEMKSIIN
jgi:hypothetical protein